MLASEVRCSSTSNGVKAPKARLRHRGSMHSPAYLGICHYERKDSPVDVRSHANARSESASCSTPLRRMAVKPPASGGSLTREQFLLSEIRKVASLREQGMPDSDIIDLAKTQNIFRYPTLRVVENIAKVCLRRLNMLEQPQLQAMLAEEAGNPERAAQINLYAMARTYRLMRDFLEVEIATRFLVRDYRFGPAEMNLYFGSLVVRNREAASWSDSTIGKLKQILRKSLHETGLLDDPAGGMLQVIRLDEAVRQGIAANDDYELLPAFSDTSSTL